MTRRVLLLLAALACCAFQRSASALYVDVAAKRILLLPSIDSTWSICLAETASSPATGCVSLAVLRAAAKAGK